MIVAMIFKRGVPSFLDMDDLGVTVREALREGCSPQEVIDVLLDHGVSCEEALAVWPDTVPCPLHESPKSPTQADLGAEFEGGRASFDDVPPLSTATPQSESGGALQRVRSLLGLGG